MEEAGGVATTGEQRVLDVKVESIHQRCPLYLGSPQEIKALERYIHLYRDVGTL
jgi:fructose-1,6-bisphosphatase I